MMSARNGVAAKGRRVRLILTRRGTPVGKIGAEHVRRWWGNDGQLYRDFKFGSYLEGVDFALRIARMAEEAGHHPDIHIHYARLRVRYFTHDAGGVTLADIDGARAVNRLWEEAQA